MSTLFPVKKTQHQDELADIMNRAELDVRMVAALSGDRPLNAREQDLVNRLFAERGDGLFADMLYVLTHKAFPTKQAKHLWDDVTSHRKHLKTVLGRDVGIAVAAHDYLTNVSNLMRGVSIIEESKMASLTNVATRDGLTGLFDQSSFKFRLKEELERQIRYGSPLSLVMFDIDFFKAINDTHGHAEGDQVLRQVADITRSQVRKLDIAARYGGEEFAIILPQVDQQAAFIFAERLRQNVQNHFGGTAIEVTVSIGVFTSYPDEPVSADDMIRNADQYLYEAKNNGRNCVCTANKPA